MALQPVHLEHVYHVFQLFTPHRHQVFSEMHRRGIGVNIHYPIPMHLHRGFEYLRVPRGSFPVAERLADETLSLPCYPELTRAQQDFVVDNLLEILRHQATEAD